MPFYPSSCNSIAGSMLTFTMASVIKSQSGMNVKQHCLFSDSPLGVRKSFFKFNHFGFTFIEIIVVVLLLSVVASVIIPSFRNSFKKIKLQNSINTMVYVMRYAQSRAITKNLLVRLEIDCGRGSYFLSEQKELLHQDEEVVFKKVSHKMGRKFTIANGLQFNSEHENILFYSDGDIEKKQIKICGDLDCFTVSTREQKGHVNVFESQQ